MISKLFSQIGLNIVIGLVIIGGIWYFFNSYNQLEQTIETIQQENARLESSLQQSNETIDRMQENFDRLQQLQAQITEQQQQAEQQLDNLVELFNDHDLTNLAKEKPALIERRINDGTREAFDRLERDTSN